MTRTACHSTSGSKQNAEMLKWALSYQFGTCTPSRNNRAQNTYYTIILQSAPPYSPIPLKVKPHAVLITKFLQAADVINVSCYMGPCTRTRKPQLNMRLLTSVSTCGTRQNKQKCVKPAAQCTMRKLLCKIVYREGRKPFVAKCLSSSLGLEKKQTHMNEVILQA